MSTTYTLGQNINLTVNFYLGDTLFDPYNVADVSIYTPAGALSSTVTPTKSSTGVYVANFTIPAGGSAGTWEHHWTYTPYVGMTPHEDEYEFAVAANSSAVATETTPVSELILDNIYSTLTGITTAAGYNQTVVRVDRYRPMTEPAPSIFPTLTFWIEDETRDDSYMVGQTERAMTLTVRAYTQDGDDPSLALERLLADVERALSVDITRGGYAYDTAAEGVVEREIVNLDRPFGVGYIEFGIRYRHVRGNPYSQ
jgi:hypothetical protein